MLIGLMILFVSSCAGLTKKDKKKQKQNTETSPYSQKSVENILLEYKVSAQEAYFLAGKKTNMNLTDMNTKTNRCSGLNGAILFSSKKIEEAIVLKISDKDNSEELCQSIYKVGISQRDFINMDLTPLLKNIKEKKTIESNDILEKIKKAINKGYY